jgi:uncharacterized protein
VVTPTGFLRQEGGLLLHSLSGHSFADGLRAGAYAVVKGQAALDRINVFPVADADTGANLAATLTAAAAGLGRTPPQGIGVAARLAADAALVGARGNSGAIFAQFLHGLAEGLHLKHEVVAGEFALAAAGGVDSAYLAVQNPREGTILSVLRAWARDLAANADHAPDFSDLMARALGAARVALAATPSQLEVLARNRVVDAGGQGFIYFLEGMLDPIRGHRVEESVLLQALTFPAAYEELAGFAGGHGGGFIASGPGRAAGASADDIDERFRYCAEALVSGTRLDRGLVERAVHSLGGSLVVAGGDAHMRIHLHTNEPAAFRAALEAMATVDSFKVDDMVVQQAAAKGASIALVTDSTVDLPEAAQLRLGMVMVPLTVTIGGSTYLDRVELSPPEFYRLLRDSDELPHTSQPNYADFRRVYETLLADHESVVSVHLSPRMSGTYQSAAAAAADVDPARIRVVDARHLSVGLGLVVEAAGEAIQDGASLDEVVAAAESAARNTRVYGATPSLDVAVKGGRVNAKVAYMAGLIRLKPIILFDEQGASHAVGGQLGYNRTIRSVARRTAEYAGSATVKLAIAHADSPAAVAYLLQQLRKRFGPDQDIPMMESGAVLSTHTGLGAIAVGVRRLEAPKVGA